MNTLKVSVREEAGTAMGNAVPAWIVDGLTLLGLYAVGYGLFIVGAAL